MQDCRETEVQRGCMHRYKCRFRCSRFRSRSGAEVLRCRVQVQQVQQVLPVLQLRQVQMCRCRPERCRCRGAGAEVRGAGDEVQRSRCI